MNMKTTNRELACESMLNALNTIISNDDLMEWLSKFDANIYKQIQIAATRGEAEK